MFICTLVLTTNKRIVMSDRISVLIAGLLFSLFFILPGCSNSYVDDIDRGDSYNYHPGFPELRTVASAYINSDNKPALNITVELVKGSLIYAIENDQYVARFTVAFTCAIFS